MALQFRAHTSSTPQHGQQASPKPINNNAVIATGQHVELDGSNKSRMRGESHAKFRKHTQQLQIRNDKEGKTAKHVTTPNHQAVQAQTDGNSSSTCETKDLKQRSNDEKDKNQVNDSNASPGNRGTRPQAKSNRRVAAADNRALRNTSSKPPNGHTAGGDGNSSRDTCMQSIFNARDVATLQHILDKSQSVEMAAVARRKASSMWKSVPPQHRMNTAHFVAMTVRLPKVLDAAYEQSDGDSHNKHDEAAAHKLLEQLVDLLSGHRAKKLNTRAVCNLLWATAKLNYPTNAPHVDMIRKNARAWVAAACTREQLRQCTAQEVCNVAYALARLTAQGILSDSHEQIVSESDSADSSKQHIVSDCWAHILHWANEDNLCQLKAKELGIFAWSIASADISLSHVQLAQLCNRMVVLLPSCYEQLLSMCIYSVGSILQRGTGLKPAELDACMRSSTQEDAADSQQTYRHCFSRFFSVAAEVFLQRLQCQPSNKSQHVANIMWGLSSYKLLIDQAATPKPAQDNSEANHFDITTSPSNRHPLYVHGKELIQLTESHLTSHFQEYQSSEVAMLLLSIAKLYQRCNSSLLDMVTDQLQLRPDTYTSASISCLAFTVSQLVSSTTVENHMTGDSQYDNSSFDMLSFDDETNSDTAYEAQRQAVPAAYKRLIRVAFQMMHAAMLHQHEQHQASKPTQKRAKQQAASLPPPGVSHAHISQHIVCQDAQWLMQLPLHVLQRVLSQPYSGHDVVTIMIAAAKTRCANVTEVEHLSSAVIFKIPQEFTASQSYTMSGRQFNAQEVVMVLGCCIFLGAEPTALSNAAVPRLKTAAMQTTHQAEKDYLAVTVTAPSRPTYLGRDTCAAAPLLVLKDVADAIWALHRTGCSEMLVYHVLAMAARALLELTYAKATHEVELASDHPSSSSVVSALMMSGGIRERICPKTISVLLKGLSAVNYYNEELIDLTVKISYVMLDSFSPAQLANTVSSIAHMDHFVPDFMDNVGNAAMGSSFSSSQLASMLWSYAYLHTYHGPLFQALLKEAVMRADEGRLEPKQACLIIWSCTIVNHNDPEALSRLYQLVWDYAQVEDLEENMSNQVFFAYLVLLLQQRKREGNMSRILKAAHGASSNDTTSPMGNHPRMKTENGSNADEPSLDNKDVQQAMRFISQLSNQARDKHGRHSEEAFAQPAAAGAAAAGQVTYPPHLHKHLLEVLVRRWLSTKQTVVSSDLQQQVFHTLKAMGAEPRLEVPILGGIFSLDLVVCWKGKLVCVEVDGPQHFARNFPSHALGATVARDRCLRALGLNLACVHFLEWRAATSRGKGGDAQNPSLRFKVQKTAYKKGPKINQQNATNNPETDSSSQPQDWLAPLDDPPDPLQSSLNPEVQVKQSGDVLLPGAEYLSRILDAAIGHKDPNAKVKVVGRTKQTQVVHVSTTDTEPAINVQYQVVKRKRQPRPKS